MNFSDLVKKQVIEWIIVTLALGGIVYTLKTSHKNSIILEQLCRDGTENKRDLKNELLKIKKGLLLVMNKQNLDPKEMQKIISFDLENNLNESNDKNNWSKEEKKQNRVSDPLQCNTCHLINDNEIHRGNQSFKSCDLTEIGHGIIALSEEDIETLKSAQGVIQRIFNSYEAAKSSNQ